MPTDFNYQSAGYYPTYSTPVPLPTGPAAQSKDPDVLQAQITRQQWQYYLAHYAPLEREALQRARQTDFTAEGDTSGDIVNQSFASTAGVRMRNFQRLGINLSAEERSAIKRRSLTAQTQASAGAENVTRRTLKSSREAALTQLVGVGRGVSINATQGISAAADAAAQREIAYKQERAAYQSSKMQTLGTAASLAFMFV